MTDKNKFSSVYFSVEHFFPLGTKHGQKLLLFLCQELEKKKTLFILYVETWFHLWNRVKKIPFPHREKKNKDKYSEVFFSPVLNRVKSFFFPVSGKNKKINEIMSIFFCGTKLKLFHSVPQKKKKIV